jgi:catechol 2,3-dioxygenase-like lactoylglutathione lyase family enzyme
VALRIRNLQVDVPAAEHDDAVAWWSHALGGTPRRADDTYTHLDGVRARVGVHLQRLGEGPAGYHLDLEADDVDAEVRRLVALGAEDVGPVPGEDEEVVLRDPAGLPFCIAPVGQPQHLSDERGDGVHLRVLLLDVPADVADEEAAFWAAALGVQSHREERYPEYVALVGVPGHRRPTNLYVQAIGEGAARMHVDLHCRDLAAQEVALSTLTARGAREVGRMERWVTLRVPGGTLACVVPDQAQ